MKWSVLIINSGMEFFFRGSAPILSGIPKKNERELISDGD